MFWLEEYQLFLCFIDSKDENGLCNVQYDDAGMQFLYMDTEKCKFTTMESIWIYLTPRYQLEFVED